MGRCFGWGPPTAAPAAAGTITWHMFRHHPSAAGLWGAAAHLASGASRPAHHLLRASSLHPPAASRHPAPPLSPSPSPAPPLPPPAGTPPPRRSPPPAPAPPSPSPMSPRSASSTASTSRRAQGPLSRRGAPRLPAPPATRRRRRLAALHLPAGRPPGSRLPAPESLHFLLLSSPCPAQVICDPAKLVLVKIPGICTHKYQTAGVWKGKVRPPPPSLPQGAAACSRPPRNPRLASPPIQSPLHPHLHHTLNSTKPTRACIHPPPPPPFSPPAGVQDRRVRWLL
jgi:hypothetical protein